MKRILLYILLTAIAGTFKNPLSSANIADDPSGTAASPELRERMYVQTDKQLYLAGETILMKFTTTDEAHIPLVLSKTGYAELVMDTVARVQMKVELTDGTGSGQMTLPEDLPSGYYRLIAYTRFMRNEGAGVFFEKNIVVINTFQSGYRLSEAEPVNEHPLPVAKGAISLSTDKATYTTRERGEISVAGLPENIHTLSVSIAGRDLIAVAEAPEPDAVIHELSRQTGRFLPEYEGHIITGELVDSETGNSLPADFDIGQTAVVPAISFAGENIWFFTGRINEYDHSVRFFTTGNPATKEIAAVLYNADEKYSIAIQSPFVNRFDPKQMPVLRIDTSRYDQLLARSVALQVFRYFPQDRSVNPLIASSIFKMNPTSVYNLAGYARFPTMAEVFTEIIINARFRRTAGKQELSVLVKKGRFYQYGYPLVLLDGVPVTDHESVYNYDPYLVERINIYNDTYQLGSLLFDGIIEIKTLRGVHQNLKINKSSKITKYEAPQQPGLFVTPDYSIEKNRHSLMPDSRHTLLWNPDLRCDGQTSIRTPFDTSDLTGEFQATIEGITKDGQTFFATTIFRVE